MVDFRVGFGYDSHRFAPDRPLVIGGIAIPYELGLAAHSDGDVLIHAVCDALLGAAGLKDIGTWFPDTDSTWKNADSTVLLTKVMELMTSRGWQVNNLDCTLVLEKLTLTCVKGQASGMTANESRKYRRKGQDQREDGLHRCGRRHRRRRRRHVAKTIGGNSIPKPAPSYHKGNPRKHHLPAKNLFRRYSYFMYLCAF